MRALPGSSISCTGESCPVPEPSDEPVADHKTRWITILAMIGLLVVAILICGCVAWYRCKTDDEEQGERDRAERRAQTGKRGYDINEEREEDDSDDEI